MQKKYKQAYFIGYLTTNGNNVFLLHLQNIANYDVSETTQNNSLRHSVFPSGHPSKYWPSPTLLNFGDRTRTGVFNVVWS